MNVWSYILLGWFVVGFMSVVVTGKHFNTKYFYKDDIAFFFMILFMGPLFPICLFLATAIDYFRSKIKIFPIKNPFYKGDK